MVWVVAIDGDNIGNIIERHILLNQVDELDQISNKIKSIFNNFQIILDKEFQTDPAYRIVLNGGDSIMFFISDRNLQKALDCVVQYFFKSDLPFTVSVGISMSPRKAYLALKFAKSVGKNKIVLYNSNSFNIIEAQSGTITNTEYGEGVD